MFWDSLGASVCAVCGEEGRGECVELVCVCGGISVLGACCSCVCAGISALCVVGGENEREEKVVERESV